MSRKTKSRLRRERTSEHKTNSLFGSYQHAILLASGRSFSMQVSAESYFKSYFVREPLTSTSQQLDLRIEVYQGDTANTVLSLAPSSFPDHPRRWTPTYVLALYTKTSSCSFLAMPTLTPLPRMKMPFLETQMNSCCRTRVVALLNDRAALKASKLHLDFASLCFKIVLQTISNLHLR